MPLGFGAGADSRPGVRFFESSSPRPVSAAAGCCARPVTCSLRNLLFLCPLRRRIWSAFNGHLPCREIILATRWRTLPRERLLSFAGIADGGIATGPNASLEPGYG